MSVDAVIIGAGVTGLSVGLELLKRGYRVGFFAKDLPEDLQSTGFASPWAGANWCSYADNNKREQKWDADTYRALFKVAKEHPDLCELIPFHAYDTVGTPEPWFKDLVLDYKVAQDESCPPGFRLATYKSFVLHAPNYLQHLASLLGSRGVELQRKKLSSVQEAYNSQEFGSVSLVVNCTGLGAKSLLGYPREDVKDIYPIRGQTVLIKAPKDYKMKCFMLTEDHPNENTTKDSELSEPTYIIPRPGPEKHVILGGAFQINNWESEPDYALSKRILQKNFKLYPGLAPPGAKSWEDIEIVSHNVGFRPARQNGCRLDLEELTLDASSTSALPNAALIPKEGLKRSTGAAAATSGQKVALVQAYGAGPAGYQASIGYALETADICDGWWAQHGGRKGSKAKL